MERTFFQRQPVISTLIQHSRMRPSQAADLVNEAVASGSARAPGKVRLEFKQDPDGQAPDYGVFTYRRP